MTLQTMKYAIEIADRQSFSAAAKTFYVSQSTLSVAIRELEAELGTTLFQRSSKGVTLTFDGEDFIKYARQIVGQSEHLEQRYKMRRSFPMRFSVSTQRLPFATRAFRALLNSIQMENFDMAIRECPTHNVIQDVSVSRSELGVLAIHESNWNSIQRVFQNSEIEFRLLRELPVFVFLRSTHPLAGHKSVSLEELAAYPFVTYDQASEHTHFTEEPLFYELMEKNIHVSDRCSKLALIRNSDCFSIGPDLPNSNADAFHSGMGEVRAIPLTEPVEPLRAGIISKKDIPLSRLAKEYLEHLIREMDALLEAKSKARREGSDSRSATRGIPC